MNPIGRNDPCPCGSGLKYKKCCLVTVENQPRANPPADSAGPILPPELRQIEDLLNSGYDLASEQRFSEACDMWAEAWQRISARLRPEMQSCSAASEAYSGSHFLSDWIQDYTEALQNAALTDRRQARAGIAFCSEVLVRFPDEDALIRENLHGDLGVLHFKAGQPDEGEKVLLELIRDLPHRSIGYAFLSDMLGEDDHPWSSGKPLNRPRAIALLEQALAQPVEDAADYDLEYRLQYLREAEQV